MTASSRDSCANNCSARASSPEPLACGKYVLAGGYDTPTLAATAHYEKADESNFRKTWDLDSESPSLHHQDLAFNAQGPLARERNGHSRLSTGCYEGQSYGDNTDGWGKFVVGLATTVAGKMWSFCRQSAFSGFSAGEGKAYSFSQPTQLDVDPSWHCYFRSTTPVPGQYPLDHDFDHESPPRPAKRLHVDTAEEWVIVDSCFDGRESSPRLSTRKVSNPLLSPEKPSGRARQSIRPPSASRASTRRSLQPVSRRISSHASYIGSPAQTLSSTGHVIYSPLLSQNHQDRRASIAPTRSPAMHNPSHTSRPGTAVTPPLSPDARKLLAKKERNDRVADKSMRKMSKQVQDLIRQGQAALGTKFEIQDEYDDQSADDGDAEAWEDAGAAGVLTKW